MAEKASTAFPASGIGLVIALVIGFAVVQELPLEKYRPGEAEKSNYQLLDLQDAESRLWQDPFAAAQRHQEALDKLLNDKFYAKSAKEHFRRHTLETLQLRVRRVPENKARLTIIGVTVAGGPFAEDAEQRRRFRYATLAGLNRLRFAPDDGKHVGYVVTRPGFSVPACSDNGRLLPERIPFEWLVKIGGQESPEEVLVLWLNEHAFARAPFKSLAALVACLGIQKSRRAISMKLLGPAFSDTLRNVLPKGERFPPNLGRIELYSASATASVNSLENVPFCDGPAVPGRTAPCVVRTIANDDLVAEQLVKELKKRAVFTRDACDVVKRTNCDHIALVSEWDSTYGQSLPGAVERAIDRDVCNGKSGCAPVVRSSYLQGLDGAGPDSSEPQNAGARAKANAKSESREASRTERAEGRQQFDYLRRLAERLRREDAELRRKSSRITAVGILGNDVYDKLLILKALRNEFPAAVFFTTDLDARLLHPEEFQWSRNLVVASSYGLALRPELQEDIPPFRDSYQTSLFLTTLLAFSPDARKYNPKELDDRRQPRVFEIGRRTAFALDPQRDDTSTCTVLGPLDCVTVHPKPPDIVPPRLTEPWLWVPFMLVLALVGLLYYPRYARGSHVGPREDAASEAYAAIPGAEETRPLYLAERRVNRWRYGSVALLVVASVLFFAWLYWSFIPALASNEEPVTFYEGISVWPSELIRVIAGALSLFLMVWAALQLDRNQLQMTKWFFPDFREKGVPVVKFRWRERGVLRRILACDLLRGQPDLKAGIDAKVFWRECVFHNLFWPRVVRTIVPAALFWALAYWSMLTWGFPGTPARGDFSAEVDKWVIRGSVPLFLLLTFFVVNATLLCKRFIGTLSEYHTLWPVSTRRHFGDVLEKSIHPHTPGATQAATAVEQLAIEHEQAYDDWIDVRAIAERTSVVGKLIYYPLFVLLLLLFARSTLFDKWDWPPGLVLTFVLSFTIVIACAVVLRMEAERARTIALTKVRRRLLVVKAGGPPGLASQLELMLQEMADMRDGAFASLTQQPVIRALLIFVSASGFVFLEYFGVVSF